MLGGRPEYRYMLGNGREEKDITTCNGKRKEKRGKAEERDNERGATAKEMRGSTRGYR